MTLYGNFVWQFFSILSGFVSSFACYIAVCVHVLSYIYRTFSSAALFVDRTSFVVEFWHLAYSRRDFPSIKLTSSQFAIQFFLLYLPTIYFNNRRFFSYSFSIIMSPFYSIYCFMSRFSTVDYTVTSMLASNSRLALKWSWILKHWKISLIVSESGILIVVLTCWQFHTISFGCLKPCARRPRAACIWVVGDLPQLSKLAMCLLVDHSCIPFEDPVVIFRLKLLYSLNRSIFLTLSH